MLAISCILFLLFLVFIVAPFFTYVEERRHFKRISVVRTFAVVQMWILLTSLEAARLSFLKYVLRQDVRQAAHESCGCIARWLLITFFDGCSVTGRSNALGNLDTVALARATNTDSSKSWAAYRCSSLFLDRPITTEEIRSARSAESPVVIVANHQSMMDVAAIFALNLKAAWVAKTTVFMIPGVGWLMYLAGYVPVERKSKTSIKSMYAKCKSCIADGWSLIIFPQGTRSRRETLPFKNGAFNLASELGLRVLPVSIHISDNIWLDGSKISVVIHEPIGGCAEKTKDAVRENSFTTIIDSLEKMKKAEQVEIEGISQKGLRESKPANQNSKKVR